jgi:hypothetical protein
MRADGAGIGKRLANSEAVTRGRIVEGTDQERIVFLGDNDARDVFVVVAAGLLHFSRLRERQSRLVRLE